jgi:autotransporter-associated beta strand protein
VSVLNGATLGTASTTGFGKALNTLDGGQDLIAAANKDALASPSTAATPGNISVTNWDSVSGAFTMEAIVWIGFDPTKNLGPTSFGGNNRATACQIISGESTVNANRLFQFRIAPLGFALSGTTIFATNSCFLTFENVRAVSAAQPTIYAPIPTSGPDAIVSNGWYHVAVTYNGTQTTANNIKFYWTLLDPTRTAASQLTITSVQQTLSGPNPLANTVTPLVIGNEARSRAGNFLGLIDEVRISKVERSSVGMMFAPASVLITSQPVSQFVAVGDPVVLNVGAGGGGTLGYQWQLANTNLPGANSSTLSIPSIAANQAGNYRVIVTNVSSGATSSVAVIRVGNLIPELFNTGLNDSRAPLLGGSADPHWQLVSSADPSFPGPQTVVDSALPGAWLANSGASQWLSPADGANTLGGLYTYRTYFIMDSADPANAQITGNWMADNQGVDVVINGTSLGITNAGVLNTFATFTITNGFISGSNTLDLIISNAPGTGPNPSGLRAELRGVATSLASAAPVVLGAPSNVSTQTLQTAVFAVAASGSAPLSYQWFHGATLLTSQTNRILKLTNLAPADAGTYSVTVSNLISTASASATLTVITPPSVAWVGGSSSDWDTFSANWQDTASLATVAFSQFDDVIFDSRGSAAPVVNLTEAISPNSITVNASTDYLLTSFGNNGGITGSLGLTKLGAGILTLDTTNNYSGATLIQSGTVQVGNNDANGSLGVGPITDNAGLSVARSDTYAIVNQINGSGAVSNIGSGGVILTASNSYSGPTVVAAGVLHARNAAALGTAAAGTTVASGGQLFVDANIDITSEAFSLSGSGPASNDGALHKGGAGATTLGGPISLAADTMIKVDGGATLNLTNGSGITGSGVSLDLAADNGGTGNIPGPIALGSGGIFKDGLGNWVLSGTNTFSGQITNNAGGITLVGNGARGNATSIVLNSGTNTPRLTLSGGVTLPSGLSLYFLGTTASPDFRCSFNTTDATNVLNSPMFMSGDGVVQFSADGTSEIDVNGPINSPAYTGKFILRGNSKGVVNSQITTGGHVSKTDGSFWTINSTGNSWVNTDVANGLLRMGASGVLPGAVSVNITAAAAVLDLNGTSQQIGLLAGPGIVASSSTTADSILSVNPPAADLFAGVIQDSVSNGTRRVGLTVRGGDITLSGTNRYTGDTTIAAGATLELLANGSISNTANIIISDGGILNPTLRSDATIVLGTTQTLKANGVAQVNGNLINNGTMQFRITKAGAVLTNDSVVGLSTITYGGILKLIVSASPQLTTSDTFKILDAGSYNGVFSSLQPATPGPGLAWDTNSLATDGTLRIAAGTVPTGTNITFQVSGNQLTLSWPSNYIGWRLQGQTNAAGAGLSTNWFDVPNATTTNQIITTIGKNSGSVFFRMIYP